MYSCIQSLVMHTFMNKFANSCRIRDIFIIALFHIHIISIFFCDLLCFLMPISGSKCHPDIFADFADFIVPDYSNSVLKNREGENRAKKIGVTSLRAFFIIRLHSDFTVYILIKTVKLFSLIK